MTKAETLPLEAKGPVKPVPILKGPAQRASEAIQSWPRVVSATHWALNAPTKVDGADFYVGAEELGHIHLDGEVHLATSRPMREALIAAGLAEAFPWYGSWSQFRIRDTVGADHAIWLFRLNYDRICSAPAEQLMQRIAARAKATAG